MILLCWCILSDERIEKIKNDENHWLDGLIGENARRRGNVSFDQTSKINIGSWCFTQYCQFVVALFDAAGNNHIPTGLKRYQRFDDNKGWFVVTTLSEYRRAPLWLLLPVFIQMIVEHSQAVGRTGIMRWIYTFCPILLQYLFLNGTIILR